MILIPQYRTARKSATPPAVVTWNPADKHANITLSNGNLTATHNGTLWLTVRATMSRSSGKYYFNNVVQAGNSLCGLLIGTYDITATDRYVGKSPQGWAYWGANGNKMNNNSWSALGAVCSTNDVVTTAVDFGAGEIWWAVNGTWQGSGDPETGANPAYTGVAGDLFPAISEFGVGRANTAIFGVHAYGPAGFSPWES